MTTTADLATENVRLRRELKAAQALAADYLKNAERAAARAAEQINTLKHALDTASRHQHDNAELRGALERNVNRADVAEAEAARLCHELEATRADAAYWCDEAMRLGSELAWPER